MNAEEIRRSKKRDKIVLIVLLTILTIAMIGSLIFISATEDVDDLADPVLELTEEEYAAKVRDDNPEVTRYLVSENCISRVKPNTSVKVFISNFGDEKIKVYKDEACQEEVTSGDVYSGLYAKYEENDRIYEISVLGDFKLKQESLTADDSNVLDESSNEANQEENNNGMEILNGQEVENELQSLDEATKLFGDADLNEIECTRIIRGAVGDEKWKITEEPEVKSADISCNNQIEKEDVNQAVNFIVFGEIDAPKAEKVNSPSLRVTKGYKNEDGSFEGRATVTLDQNAQNGTKNIYRIANKEDQYIEINDKGEVQFDHAGTYTIVAYTLGEDGNKSKGTLKTVVVTEGMYSLTLISGENIATVQGSGEYKVGDMVNINARLAKPAPGYEITWGSWISSDREKVENQANKAAEIVMPKGNMTLTAIASKKTIDYSITYNLDGGSLEEGKVNPTAFTVESTNILLNNPSKEGYEFIGWVENEDDEPNDEFTISTGSIGDKELTAVYEKLPAEEYLVKYYKEDLTGSNYILSETARYSADIGTIINAEEKGYIKNIPGFSFNTNTSDNVISGKIVKAENDEGRLTLKLYYKRNSYTLTLDKNEHIDYVTANKDLTINEDEQLVAFYKYEEPVIINAKLNDLDGYTYEFKKWESKTPELIANQSNIESTFTMPEGNIKLKAIGERTAREDTHYAIEYYYQQDDGTYPTVVEEEDRIERIGTTDETITLSEIDKHPTRAGYVLDEGNPNNITSEKIAGDGSLVFKLYFKKQFKVRYVRGDHGTFGASPTQPFPGGGPGNPGGILYSGLDYGSSTPTIDEQVTGEPGYEFIGWDQEVAETVTGDMIYVAQWRAIDYNIVCDLVGGDYRTEDREYVRFTYTVEDAPYTLINPVKRGYTFIGWTGDNGENLGTEVTINPREEGFDLGDKYYTAHWSADPYSIQYHLEGGQLPDGKINPTTYTIDTTAFELTNPVREGYRFDGWTGSRLSGKTNPVVINPASTNFVLENKEFTANWEANNDTQYKVEYYGENLAGTGYDLLAENYLSGTTDQEVTIDTTREFTGFTFDINNVNNVLTGTVSADSNNPTVLKAYYTRNSYNLRLIAGNNVTEVTGTNSYKYQENVSINAELANYTGYKVTFLEWRSEDEEAFRTIETTNPSQNFTMPANNVTLTAIADKSATQNQYTVEYYYEGIDGTYNQDSSRQPVIRTDKKTEEIAEIKEEDKAPILEGYEYNELITLPESSAEVVADGSTVLRVYFSRKTYTVTLVKGTNISTVVATETGTNPVNSGETITVKYGKEVAINASGYADTGYTFSFVNWTGTYSSLLGSTNSMPTSFTMPHDNVTLTAVGKQTANANTAYIIGYYYQSAGTYPSIANTSTPMQGTTDDIAKVNLANVEVTSGYALDLATIEANGTVNANNELYGTITGEGTLELKIYFKQQFTVEYKKGAHGAANFEEKTYSGLDYGAATPEYQGTPLPATGYAFNSWEDLNGNILAATVTENKTYVATWNTEDYSITYNLNNGDFPTSELNNVKYTYTIEDANYTLVQPIRYGYTFKGWTGSNGTQPQTTVTIENGSTGDKTYTANWEADPYTITYYYEINGGTPVEIEDTGYTREYTIESSTITLPNPRAITGYDFEGWTGEEITEKTTSLTINTSAVGFELKNRTYTAHFVSKTGITYSVEYYGENLAGNGYVYLGGNTFEGRTDDEIYIGKDEPTTPYASYTTVGTMKFPVFLGFTLDETKQTEWTGTISANPDNPTVLKAYYTRNSYTLTLDKNNLVANTTGSGTYKYQEIVPINATLGTKQGYTVSFYGWISGTTDVADIINANPSQNFSMPARDVTLVATAQVTPAQNQYTVEYYYEGTDGVYAQSPQRLPEIRTDKKTEEIAEITEADKLPVLEGYEYNEVLTLPDSSAEVAANGSTVLKVYFSRKLYTVTLVKGTNIDTVTAEEQSANPANIGEIITVKYGKTVGIDATGYADTGYTFSFVNWTGTYSSLLGNSNSISTSFIMPHDNVILTAVGTQTANINTAYTIGYYYQSNGAYPSLANTSTPMEGTTDETALLALSNINVPEGYALDMATIEANGTVNANNELYGTITGDGSLEFKVYFKQQFTVEYKKGAHGAADFQEKTFTGLDYNSATPAYSVTPLPQEGYIFVGWEDLNGNAPTLTVTENKTYIAQYALITYYISYDELYNNEPGLVTSYNVESETFTIGHPTRYGYSFAGWTGSNGDIPEDVTIPTGSTGDRQYTANWTPETYTITYNLNGGALPQDQTNPESYTIETGLIELVDPSRAGYSFDGWTGTDITGNPVTPVVLNTLRDDFELKNRSYTANWTANGDTQYKVEYYGENLAGTGYDLLAENYLGGTTDQTATIDTTREFTGFTFDSNNANNVLTGTISADPNNPTVLKAYYTRNSYILTLDKNNLVANTTGAGTYKYQEIVPINATLGTKQGYTVSFYGWISGTTDVADIINTNPSQNFVMPAKDVELTAEGIASPGQNQYTVEYYYEAVDGTYSQDNQRPAVIRTDKKTEEIAEITEADKLPVLDGFEFNSLLTTELESQKEVAADGSTVLRVYFSRCYYTVTLVKGTNIDTVNAEEASANPANTGEIISVKYGKTVGIEATGYADTGYTFSFVNWTGTYSSLLGNANSVLTSFTMPHDNVTLTAVGKQDANTDTAYTIGYYYQANGAYPTNANTSVPMTGETGDIASIDLDDVVVPEGYALDTATIGANGTVNADNELYGTINGEGTLELKVFFKQQFTVQYVKGAHGASDFQERIFTGLDYGVTTPSYTGNPTPLPGYSFNGWDKTIANIVTENATYTAQYSLITYYISYDELYDNEPGLVTSYNVETDTFTIGHPTRYGYSFAGWTGSNGDTPEVDVTIPTGSTGDRYYTANWTPETYTITYNLNGGTLPQGQTNPESYTLETGLIEVIDPSRAGYSFDGWTGTDIIGNPVTPVVLNTLRDDFELKNRSYTANWTANTNTQYKIEYYGENLAGTGYELLAENYLGGTTDTTANIDTTRTFTGFTFDSNNAQNVLSGTITASPMLVLKAYYTRDSYTLTLNSTDGITQVTGAGTYKYGQTVNIDAALDTRTGFDISFNKWESETQGVSDIVVSDPAYSFTMPATNVTYTAVANVVALNARYIVEYYYEGDNGYETSPTTSDRTRQGQVGTEVYATASDKISREVGYEYDQNKTEVVEQSDRVTVTADGNAKIKIYFKQSTYTVTLLAGDERITGLTITKDGVDNTGTTSVSKGFIFGEYATITASVGSEIGYTIDFAGWTSNNTNVVNNTSNRTITFEVTDSVTLTATSTRTPNATTYNVEYYYQQADGTYPSSVTNDNRVTRNALVGDLVSLTSADREPIVTGYTYDSNAQGKVESATVSVDNNGDPITVLKAYYKKQFTVTYKPGEHGNFTNEVHSGLDYGALIPEYEGNYEGKDGYIFDSWITESTATTVTENIEYTATWVKMAKPTITHSPTTWTNGNVTVTMTKPTGYEDYDIQYSVGNTNNYVAYTVPFEVTDNTFVYGRLVKGSNEGDPQDHEIDNIDKVAPTFTNTSVDTSETDIASITTTGNDNLSGIVEYGFKKSDESIYDTYTCFNSATKVMTFDEIYENGTYQIYAKDAAGNISATSVEITHIIPPPVARIVAAPSGFELLVGTEYLTLTDALGASDLAAQAGNVEIQIIHGIHDEANVIKANRDYTIDLNDFTVQNSSGKVAANIGGLAAGEDSPTLIVDGKLTLVDKGTVMDKGLLKNKIGDGIYITLNGEATLGKDENGAPDIYAPVVQGTTYGIEKQIDTTTEKILNEMDDKYYYPEGTLNFYDGKIIGGTAAFNIQKVDDTPLLYDPTVVTNSVTGNQESTLAIVSGIEATIGKKRYIFLEQAIDAANNKIGTSADQVEITIVKDLSKDADHKVVVDETKNIKLDLNGHVFTTVVNDYVLENYGKLEIYDSGASAVNYYTVRTVYDLNIVDGRIENQQMTYGKDFNFDFEITEEGGDYLLETYSDYATWNWNCNIYIDNELIGDLGEYAVDGHISMMPLGNIAKGNHNIRFYNETGYTPNFQMFEIKSTTGSGKIISSTNSTIYNGVSENAGTTGYQDVDLNNAVANGDYYFESRAEGGLISNNTGIADTARSYIELDLSNQEGMYEVVVNATISSRKIADIGYITVRTDTISPDYNNTYERKVYVSGLDEDKEYKFNLAGGEKYYIHLGYRKPQTYGENSDCFIIKNMKYRKLSNIGELTISSGIYECNKGGTSSDEGYLGIIENNGILNVNGGRFKTMSELTWAIYNGKDKNSAFANINGGTLISYRQVIYNQQGAKLNFEKGRAFSYVEAALWNKGLLYAAGEDIYVYGQFAVANDRYTGDGFRNGIVVIENGKYQSSLSTIQNDSPYGSLTLKGGQIAQSGNSWRCSNQ